LWVLVQIYRFIEHSPVVTTTKYNTVTDFHTTNHSSLIFPVYFHYSSLSASWQRIYNTGTIKVSLIYTLPVSLYYSTHRIFKSHVKSSQADYNYELQLNISSLMLAWHFSFLQLTASHTIKPSTLQLLNGLERRLLTYT
jgi:hypothetical protein